MVEGSGLGSRVVGSRLTVLPGVWFGNHETLNLVCGSRQRHP